MSLTSTGLDIKRLTEVIAELEAALRLELGEDVDVSSDSLLGIINSIFGAAIADQWALSQAVYDAFNIDTAQGKQLDDLVTLVGITRLPASPTIGNIEFTGVPTTTIPNSTTFSDTNSNTYINPSAIVLSVTECTNVILDITTVADSTLYTLVIDGDTYAVTSGVGATAISIVAAFVALIGSQPDYTATKSSDGTQLIVTSNTALDTIAINVPSEMIAIEVTSIGIVQNTVTGAIDALANTIINIDTPVAGLTSVNNPVALTLGREEETDEELRKRQKESVQIAGTATVPAIEASLGQVQGVVQAIVIENRTLEVDSGGRPGKSYEAVVEGGNDEDIAQAVWETKPAGVETYGIITEQVTDGQGNVQTVRFSRPAPQYIWAKVDYTLYDEEAFPTDGEETIKQAIVDYGEALELGNDVIPKRFYGPIYSAVSGIEDLTVTMASSGGDPNTEPSPAGFTEDAIDIAGVQVARFDTSRITVTLT